jgi:hypothetical protein
LDDTGSFKPGYINDICSSNSSKTSTVQLGTAIVPGYTHHSLALAQQALAIDDIAPGRLHLGIGPSHRPLYSLSWFEERIGYPLLHLFLLMIYLLKI